MRAATLFLAGLVVVGCINAAGEALAVPGDYPSIQAAIDAAGPGDIIEVAPGIYEENLVIRKPVELRGAGPDNTIVRKASMIGELLRVIDAAGGRISGFKFEHTEIASLTAHGILFPDAVTINNSSVEIHNCTVGPSAGCGITIDQQSNCTVVECLLEGNTQSGIFVRTENTAATLLRNKCINNQYAGIVLTKGATAEVEENICANNGKYGIRVVDKGSHVHIKKSTIALNSGPGISIEKWAHGSIEDSIINENDENGIIFKLGANGMVRGNTLEQNGRHGIAVQSLAVSVTVSDNTCTDNRRNGISVYWGAGGNVSGNTCKGNGWNGIAVGCWYTNPVVRNNECSENTRNGVLFNRGATGIVEGNVCRGNKIHGILVTDENTSPDIGLNMCEDNGGEDIAREEGNPVSRQDQFESEEMGCALAGEYFDEIETMVDLLRQHKSRYNGGAWQLDYVYYGLKQGCGDLSPDNREAFAALIERWKKAYPESATPLITQAAVHMGYGWAARGDNYAYTVSEENWKIFHKEMGVARGYLLEAEALGVKDPHLYKLLLDVCNCLDCSASEIQDIYDKGIAIDLGYFPLHSTRLWYLIPRWGARPREAERFAEKAFELTRAEYGHTLYAMLASGLAIRIGTDDYQRTHSFDWTKIQQGSSELMEAFPESNYLVNQYCLMACIHGDAEKARSLFDKIADDIDEAVWRNRPLFLKWKQWAMSAAPASHRDLSIKAPETSTLNALQDQAAFLFESVSWTEAALVLDLFVVGIAFFLHMARKKKRSKTPPKTPAVDQNNADDQPPM